VKSPHKRSERKVIYYEKQKWENFGSILIGPEKGEGCANFIAGGVCTENKFIKRDLRRHLPGDGTPLGHSSMNEKAGERSKMG